MVVLSSVLALGMSGWLAKLLASSIATFGSSSRTPACKVGF